MSCGFFLRQSGQELLTSFHCIKQPLQKACVQHSTTLSVKGKRHTAQVAIMWRLGSPSWSTSAPFIVDCKATELAEEASEMIQERVCTVDAVRKNDAVQGAPGRCFAGAGSGKPHHLQCGGVRWLELKRALEGSKNEKIAPSLCKNKLGEPEETRVLPAYFKKARRKLLA